MSSAAIALLLAAAPVRMVVVDTVDVSGKDPTAARLCTQILVAEATATNRYSVMGSAEIQQILGVERQRQLLGCSDASSSCLAELSGALGADYLLTSQLARVGSQFRLDVRLVDATKGAIVSGAGDFFPGTEEAVANGSQRLVRSVLAYGSPGAAASTAAPPTAVDAAAPGKGHSLVSKIVLGVAAGAVVAAGVVTAIAGKNYGDLNTAAAQVDRQHYDLYVASQPTWNRVADGLWVGAAVTVVAGLLLWFLL